MRNRSYCRALSIACELGHDARLRRQSQELDSNLSRKFGDRYDLTFFPE